VKNFKIIFRIGVEQNADFDGPKMFEKMGESIL
jgi:hypothetical protein